MPVAAMFAAGEKDSHGNLQLSGTGALGDYLAKYLKQKADVKRVRADTFGYLQRSFPGVASKVDQKEAFQAGQAAVRAALESVRVSKDANDSKFPRKGTIAIVRENGKKYKVACAPVPIQRTGFGFGPVSRANHVSARASRSRGDGRGREARR